MCSSFISAILGTLIGSVITLLGQWIAFRRETSKSRTRDDGRKVLLRQMLDNPGPDGWRKMQALSGVIGASRDETALLLIDIGARASETGNDVWAYIAQKPLP